MKLTKKAVDALESKGKEYYVMDDGLPGFGVRVGLSGRKVYIVRYRNRYRRQRVMNIGRVTDWTLEDARARAREIFVEVAKGSDPFANGQEFRDAVTMRELADRYLRDHSTVKKKASSANRDRMLFDKYIVPHFGATPLPEIDLEAVQAFHATFKKKPVAGNRALALLSHALNKAEAWKYRPIGSNPTRHVERFPERQRERIPTEAELARIGEALASYPTRQVRDAIILLIMTGCRKNEILGAQWDDVKWERKILELRSSKTDSKSTRARLVQLSEVAIEYLRSMEKREGCPYIIPARYGAGHMRSINKAWYEILETAQVEGVRIHDLRHLFGSTSHRLGSSLRTVAMLLRHTKLSTTERYAQGYDEDRESGANMTGNYLAKKLGLVTFADEGAKKIPSGSADSAE